MNGAPRLLTRAVEVICGTTRLNAPLAAAAGGQSEARGDTEHAQGNR